MIDIILTLKYRLRGTYNDFSKYLINMLKFYGQGILVIFGALISLLLFLQTIVNTSDINIYFNYIFPIVIIGCIVGYIYSPLTLIIFSNPDIFYLIRMKKLFKKIAWIELAKKNIGMVAMVLWLSYFIKSNIESAKYISILASLLIIPIVANIKFFIFNKSNNNNLKIITMLIFSIQILVPNIYLIGLEYFISIVIVSLVLNDLNLEKLIPICKYTYNVNRVIKLGSSKANIETSAISSNKSEIILEDIAEVSRKSIYFKYKKRLSFLIKDYKSIKNRTIPMNVMFISLIISVGVLNILFEKYRIILYALIYLIVNSQLKNVFESNYYMLFNKVALCSSIKNFINETSYFSIIIYTAINIMLFILEYSLYSTIPFILLISINSVLITSYNSSKNLNISVFNLINIALASMYVMLNNKIIILILIVLFNFILYKFLYKSISSNINFISKP